MIEYVSIKLSKTDFNPEVIMNSGQIFRMYKEKDGYHVYSGEHGLVFDFDEQSGCWRFYTNIIDWQCYWVNFFDLESDYNPVFRQIHFSKDKFIQQAQEYSMGMRILRQDVWDTILGFMISQQNTIPKIRKTLEILSKNWGNKCSYFTPQGIKYFYSIPTADRIANLSLKSLTTDTMVGFRGKYILKLANDIQNGTFKVSDLQGKNYSQAMKILQTIKGIGPKISNCVCLYGLHLMESYPIDTWMEKIIKDDYPQYESTNDYLNYINSRFSGFQGYIQQIQFYYKRNL